MAHGAGGFFLNEMEKVERSACDVRPQVKRNQSIVWISHDREFEVVVPILGV